MKPDWCVSAICEACNGSGLDVQDAPCPACGGIGEIHTPPVRAKAALDALKGAK